MRKRDWVMFGLVSLAVSLVATAIVNGWTPDFPTSALSKVQDLNPVAADSPAEAYAKKVCPGDETPSARTWSEFAEDKAEQLQVLRETEPPYELIDFHRILTAIIVDARREAHKKPPNKIATLVQIDELLDPWDLLDYDLKITQALSVVSEDTLHQLRKHGCVD